MATCSSADSVLEAASHIKSSASKLNTFVNGTASQTVQLGTGDPTPTLRKFVADAQDVVTQAALDAGQTVLDDVVQNAADIAALQSGKADKVEDAVEGHFAGLDVSGNLTDSGRSPSDITALEEAVESLEERKADKFVPADVGNLAELNSTGNLRDAGRAVEDFVPLLAYANGEAIELSWQNRMAIARYEDWLDEEADRNGRDMDKIAYAGNCAMQARQAIRDLIDAFDESVAQHRLQIRLFDGTNPTSSSRPVLFIIMGQSNALGTGHNPPFDRAVGCGSFFSWHDGSNSLKPIADPIGEISRGSAWCQFARRFFALTGRKALLLNMAHGGSAVTDGGYTTTNTWADNGYGDLRATRQAIWNIFAAAVPASSYDLGAILWIQGETDAGRIYNGTVSVQDYIDGTLDVFDWTRTLIGSADCPVFLGKIGYNSACLTNQQLKNAWTSVQDAENAMCNGEDIFMGFSMAPEYALRLNAGWYEYMTDDIHYSSLGYAICGNAFARSVVNYLNF